VVEEAGRTVKVLPTVDAATSVNLEYLSWALQVRKREGREPLFSLDPVVDPTADPGEVKDVMQVKRFEPEWLAGTSVGEVMFQADYHLKELSMGEYEQPVVGMKSCFDLAEEEGFRKEWRAREWFVVKQAGIYLSDGKVLTPYVKMGVEAREQIRGPKGMEDARLTRRDHPLVKYAESFTKHFDVIAERKSAIYHLRELAKASVLAKYLMDDNFSLEESWFSLAGEGQGSCAMEVPQLWNERCYSKIQVKDGKLVDAEKGISPSMHGVYGGVAFQLEEVPTLQASRLPRADATVTARALALAGGGKARSFGPVRARPQGVDLNLDSFDLSAPTALDGSGAQEALDAPASYGKAFWRSLGSDTRAGIKPEDKRFFKALFNPHLSDRRKEGDLFVPPHTSFGHLQKLRDSVRQEGELQERRRKQFFSKDFAAEAVGPLYPASWESSFAVARERARKSPAAGAGQHGWCPTGPMAASLQQVLKSTAPVFDKSAEDGTRFRIYHAGSFEVRTTQEHDGQEVIGVVFSGGAPAQPGAGGKASGVRDDDRIVKVTEYVESAEPAAGAAEQERADVGTEGPGIVGDSKLSRVPCHYYTVFETAAGSAVVSEKLKDGTVAWTEDPSDLEARCSLAKVTGCADCRKTGLTVQEMKGFRAEELRCTAGAAPESERRRYARGLFLRALPPQQKGWEALTGAQRRAAEQLGAQGKEGWDERAAGVWRVGCWWDLTDLQRSAAKSLGMDEEAWEAMAR